MQNKENLFIRFLYNTCIGRFVLKIFVDPRLSEFAGRFLNSSASKFLVPRYIKKHHIDMKEYRRCSFDSFNDFFIREKSGIEIDMSDHSLISPCDGYLSVYKIKENGSYKIKNVEYTLSRLLQNEGLAKKYINGLCFVFRLAPDNYHRYCYIDDGMKSDNYKIKGALHCVRPAATEKYPVYIENSREYTILNTTNFGDVVQIEVGALLVGKINNHHREGKIFKGEEKGYFEFGGSTIILLFEMNRVMPYNEISENSLNGKETKVRAGKKIAEKMRR